MKHYLTVTDNFINIPLFVGLQVICTLVRVGGKTAAVSLLTGLIPDSEAAATVGTALTSPSASTRDSTLTIE